MSKDTKDPVHQEIFRSYEYDKFIFIKENREINKDALRKLTKSFEKNGDLEVPITINSEFHILEGQHRFMVREKLGLPILYYINNEISVDDIVTLNNVNAKWKLPDYLLMHIKIGKNKDYEDFEWFIKKYDLKVTIGLVIVYGHTFPSVPMHTQQVLDIFKSGDLRFARVEKAKEIAELLIDFNTEFKFRDYNKKNFAEAFVHCFELPRNIFDPKRLFRKLQTRSQDLKIQAKSPAYVDLFETILNAGVSRTKQKHLPRVREVPSDLSPNVSAKSMVR